MSAPEPEHEPGSVPLEEALELAMPTHEVDADGVERPIRYPFRVQTLKPEDAGVWRVRANGFTMIRNLRENVSHYPLMHGYRADNTLTYRPIAREHNEAWSAGGKVDTGYVPALEVLLHVNRICDKFGGNDREARELKDVLFDYFKRFVSSDVPMLDPKPFYTGSDRYRHFQPGYWYKSVDRFGGDVMWSHYIRCDDLFLKTGIRFTQIVPAFLGMYRMVTGHNGVTHREQMWLTVPVLHTVSYRFRKHQAQEVRQFDEIYFKFSWMEGQPERATFAANRVLGRPLASRGLFWPEETGEDPNAVTFNESVAHQRFKKHEKAREPWTFQLTLMAWN